MGDCQKTKGIKARHSVRRPVLRRLYYVMDMTTFRVELYQTLALVRKSFKSDHWGLKRDVNYLTIYLKLRDKQTVILENRFIIGFTEDIYIKMIKKDERFFNTMSPNDPQHPNNVDIIL